MRLRQFLLWCFSSVPREPRKPGLLMRLYYWWCEAFSPAGHALLAFAFFATLIFIMFSPFARVSAAVVFAVFVAAFAWRRRPAVKFTAIRLDPSFEGSRARLEVTLYATRDLDAVGVALFRMPTALKLMGELPLRALKAGESAAFIREIETPCRGAFVLPQVAAVAPEPLGLMRKSFLSRTPMELLVYPAPLRVKNFQFLTSGERGRDFALLLMPSLSRGLDFIGVREYREGDSLRDLYYRAFARYGKPFTKEFSLERGAGVVLAFDAACDLLTERMHVEFAIRLCAGLAAWLAERGILGRFFIGNRETELARGSEMRAVLDALARLPQAGFGKYPHPVPWEPAARPMGPVLGVSVVPRKSPFFKKQIVTCGVRGSSDGVLLIEDGAAEVEL